MNIKTKLNKFTIDDYIKSCGLDNVDGELCDYVDFPLLDYLQEPICIVQDSDMDGVMSAAIVCNFLKQNDWQADVIFHNGKQHVLHDVMEQIVGKYATVIVPDAGSQDDYDTAILCGMEVKVIVLDHHEYKECDSPATIINCKDWVNGNYLSGGAVCDYVLRSNQYDLAACSIISDVMPLNDKYNRYVVNHGLKEIHNPFLCYLVDKLNKGIKPTPKWVAWSLAPLVNAVCRSDNQEAKELMFRAFVNEANFDNALAIMRKCKREQDNEVKTMLESIEPDNSHKFVVAFGDEKRAAYTGLVAGKLSSEYNKPVLMLRELDNTRYCGSLRSPIPLLFEINSSNLAVAQGHECAAGITVKKSQLPRLLKWADSLDIDFNPPIEVACELNPKDIDIRLCEAIQEHNDLWGKGIEEPIFYSKISEPNSINIFRKSSNTLRIDCDGISFIKFRVKDEFADRITALGADAQFEITYTLSINEYNGIKSCQGIIQDLEIVEPKDKDFMDWDKVFN